ncbi:hypothetical protein K6L09_41625 [Burkholderia cepacia]
MSALLNVCVGHHRLASLAACLALIAGFVLEIHALASLGLVLALISQAMNLIACGSSKKVRRIQGPSWKSAVYNPKQYRRDR